jgi:hypothetical protein
MQLGLRGPDAIAWVRAQEAWGDSPPSDRTIHRHLAEVADRGIDLCAALDSAPARRTLGEYRDAQHQRLAETIQRLIVDARLLEAQREAALQAVVEGDGEEGAEAAATSRAAITERYGQQIRQVDETRLKYEREYRASMIGVDPDRLTDDQVRTELIAALAQGLDQFTYGEAQRLRDMFQSLIADIEAENEDEPDWIE